MNDNHVQNLICLIVEQGVIFSIALPNVPPMLRNSCRYKLTAGPPAEKNEPVLIAY